MEPMLIPFAIIICLIFGYLFIKLWTYKTIPNENILDVYKDAIEIDTVQDINIINNIEQFITSDIKGHRVKPLLNIDDNQYRLLESFLDKGNIGFYEFKQGSNIPKYYVRKIKDKVKLIVFKDNDKFITYLNISYDQFLKDIITYVRKGPTCEQHKH